MTREEIYDKSRNFLNKNPCLLLEAATGIGKTKISIDLINDIITNKYQGKKTSMLLLVAKRVHKQTWKEEFEKWGGIKVDNIVIECYESLKNHTNETFDFVLMDEVHHLKSEVRLNLFSTLHFTYMLGLSATIPKKLKMWFNHKCNAWTVSCALTEAIEDDILPEPEILLVPLDLENTRLSETIVINPKVKGKTVIGEYKNIWKYKKNKKVKATIKCTQRQKLMEMDSTIEWMKDMFMRTRNPIRERSWLYLCGKRLEFLSDCKIPIVNFILSKLEKERTITFCKTINQAEDLGKHCIHSQNKDAEKTYNDFNEKKINHITAVNILNENANLVDCKYAIFNNLTSSEVMQVQRLGRSMRHKSPVIIIPYYRGTREEEIVKKMFQDYNRDFIKYRQLTDF